MSRPAMFTRLRPAALAIAAEWRIPGLDPDDVRQEALLALWLATAKHDPERGPWSPFARAAVKSRMTDLLRMATKQKRTAVVLELDEQRDRDPADLAAVVENRERLREGLEMDWSKQERDRRRWRESKRRGRERAAA